MTERGILHTETGRAFEGVILALSNVMGQRDPYTGNHQYHVATIAEQVARRMHLSEKCIEGIRIGALVHDIGKIKIPAEILSRPGKLSTAEMDMIKSHPATGRDIVHGIDLPWPVEDIIMQHHERMDGSGYPLGLQGDEICLEARIVGPCDALEAIVSHRPYRPAKELGEALDYLLSERGKAYQPEVIDILAGIIKDGSLDQQMKAAAE